MWPRIKNVHSSSKGRLVKRASSPPGVDAAYDLEHVAGASSQSGTIDGEAVAYSGQSVTFRIHHKVGTFDTIYTITMEQPEGC